MDLVASAGTKVVVTMEHSAKVCKHVVGSICLLCHPVIFKSNRCHVTQSLWFVSRLCASRFLQLGVLRFGSRSWIEDTSVRS